MSQQDELFAFEQRLKGVCTRAFTRAFKDAVPSSVGLDRNLTEVICEKSGLQALTLAQKATVTTHGTASGTLIAVNVSLGNGRWRYLRFNQNFELVFDKRGTEARSRQYWGRSHSPIIDEDEYMGARPFDPRSVRRMTT